ncbi:MAG: PKD domain-containing protein [Acidobacteriota bacterium]
MRRLLPLLAVCATGCDSPLVGHPPTAALSAPSSCDLGASVTLDGSGSSDPDGDIVLYHFVVPDGSPERRETVPVIEHTCRLAGIFEARLRVVDVEGHESSATSLISVRRP